MQMPNDGFAYKRSRGIMEKDTAITIEFLMCIPVQAGNSGTSMVTCLLCIDMIYLYMNCIVSQKNQAPNSVD